MNVSEEELKRQLAYYKKLSDEVAGQNIRSDSTISLLKRKLTQKENGFTILSALHDVFGQQIHEKEFFTNVLELINITLKMDKTIVLWRSQDQPMEFYPKFLLGYQKPEEKDISSQRINFSQASDQELIRAFLCHQKSEPNPIHELIRESLLLPNFIAVPIRVQRNIESWLISGRDQEAWPFYPPLDEGDMDTLIAIGGFLEAGLANARLYASLERANQELEAYNHELELRVAERTKDLRIRNQELSIEKKRSEDLLLNILPKDTADELKKNGFAKAKLQENATIMFTDFVNFTKFSSAISSEELVAELDHCFRNFDTITTKYGLEKIKTIGDAHMSASGVTGEGGNPANVIRAGLEMRDFIEEYRKQKPEHLREYFRIRVGINSGPVVAGVVGLKKFSFDIWGDPVNTASRMESSSIAGKVNVSHTTYLACKDEFDFEPRGEVSAKNKGDILMYFVENKKILPFD
ncbi:adenylate/guanylate cyclase domain-containing protein [Algoriphagus mannitolivorans]|uniref:adenylate/guanylate cyclase domain-containing protein n=1 Tax=Algoriphagus mannitolivorans TaxID=226504 RepID=UPI000685B2E6|nr:adenylate/guanylate cyclase domain-containing protein [Algoriphagus mannitolivorans]